MYLSMHKRRDRMNESGVLNVNCADWKTPYSDLPDTEAGTARLRKSKYSRGYYHMEDIQGYLFFRVVGRRSLPVTSLQIKNGRSWHVWMVDDPLHWIGTSEYVKKLKPGNVLCAGLGLGLMLFHLYERKDITEITVVERNLDVVRLIAPYLPKDSRVQFCCTDFYSWLAGATLCGEKYDNIYWDLAVGNVTETKSEFVKGKTFVNAL